MKKSVIFLFLSLVIFVLTSCSTDNGELVGSSNYMSGWYQPDPFGVVYVPAGSYHMGASDQDVASAFTQQAKQVTISPFYMDQTEISNDEYRQFTEWVVDSLKRTILKELDEDYYAITVDEYGEDLDEPRINWYASIKESDSEVREALDEVYYPPSERIFGRKQIDVRKVNYEYIWVDYRAAARRSSRNWKEHSFADDRSVFIKKSEENVYPDTLTWIHDFSYSYNEPMTLKYNSHPAFADYPVVGVSWMQASAFCAWRTFRLDLYNEASGRPTFQKFRLPTESEWEWAARGGLANSPYPWGGPYPKNYKGCFLSNFKPMRGNYTVDGGIYPVEIFSYTSNGYGLYCMSGNVAEWTSNAFDESAYNFAHDLNMNFMYTAKDSDPETLKRKVIRGGSWKDIGFYVQNSTRTYEYQDTSKCYIGFRCVQSYLGRSKSDVN